MPLEIELKLQLDPRHIARLHSHTLFKRATHSASRKLYSIYYDTPDLQLWRAGLALRLRRAGKRWVQTIKSEAGVAAGMHRRNEFEAAVATQFPDFSVIGGDLAAHFAAPELRARLKPVMITEFTRTNCLLAPAKGSAIEASIDRGTVTSGNSSAPICELELEVKTGPPWRAYQIALQLLDAAPLLLEDRSKAERGIALYLREPRAPRKAPPSPVTTKMTGNEAFKALVQSCLGHYIANQRGMLKDADPEYLHQARVALRRLRSVFNTFSPLLPAAALAVPAAETRWLSHELGRARDWDVFAAETLPRVAARHSGNSGMAALTHSALRLRQTTNRETRRAVASARGQGLLLSLGGWLSTEPWLETLTDASVPMASSAVASRKSGPLPRVTRPPAPSADGAQHNQLQEPVAGFARTVLDVASKRVSKRGRNIGSLAPRQLHRLRIAVKKLRYAADFFDPLYPRKRTKAYLARLAELQQVLGTLNDTAITPQLLAALDASSAVPRAALDLVADRNALTRARELKRLARAWQQFKRAKTYW
jgi:triphosphatase